MRYNILIFDADDTLFDFKASEKEALEKTLVDYNMNYDEDYHLKIYKDINTKIWKELEDGLITQKELKIERFRRYCMQLNLDFDVTDFANRYMENLSNSSILFEDSLDLIKELHGKFQLFIITNGLSKVQNGRIKNSIISKYFNDIIVSEEVGVSKPNPDIFKITLEKNKIKDSDNILMIGDSLTSDIKGGINFGIDTCLYNPKRIQITEEIKPTYEISTLKELLNLL
ncbi:YjjG family noncanonical pyrimidine nucleotidase [Cetobacterium somerae]|uniref:YjjG family noncanonical pyrimidine nucleotidase n=1 Tax=Cetobacterium sp. NK01 TaxID=2993530 RepID=UPI002116E02E|nr:YjjG family noncanonical pyrimidine nucleotidase [Cetobacterium sp. NK01]MCQ8212204.1 YjjG family noncanonical pyrimidine nucleotidase [Cetobacterium sp. NK01]